MKIEIRNLGQADFIVKDAEDEIILGSGDHVILTSTSDVSVSEKLPEPVSISQTEEVINTTVKDEQPEVDDHVS